MGAHCTLVPHCLIVLERVSGAARGPSPESLSLRRPPATHRLPYPRACRTSPGTSVGGAEEETRLDARFDEQGVGWWHLVCATTAATAAESSDGARSTVN